MHCVTGTFEVAITPVADEASGETAGIGRMRLEKRFHGGLEATAAGCMLAQGDGRRFGAYVAIEQVDGELDGRKGCFALVHHARMNDGTPEGWTVTVVPGSGTGELDGLAGEMRIEVADGLHRYTFNYDRDALNVGS